MMCLALPGKEQLLSPLCHPSQGCFEALLWIYSSHLVSVLCHLLCRCSRRQADDDHVGLKVEVESQ